jgi:hypothetical protein
VCVCVCVSVCVCVCVCARARALCKPLLFDACAAVAMAEHGGAWSRRALPSSCNRCPVQVCRRAVHRGSGACVCSSSHERKPTPHATVCCVAAHTMQSSHSAAASFNSLNAPCSSRQEHARLVVRATLRGRERMR